MKIYHSFEQIDKDLQRLKLQRDIALEEIKGVKYQLQNDLQPANWISTLASAVKKYGILYLIRRLFK